MSIKEKLLNVQQKLKAPKSQYNDYGGYSFRSCEDIVEAAKPLLAEQGLLLLLNDEIEVKGDRYYIKAIASVTDGEDSIEVTAYAREQENRKGMDASQITGAASSYARKYALNGLFAIDDNKDADSTNKHGKDNNQNNNNYDKTTPNKNHLKAIRSYYKKNQNVVEPILTEYLNKRGYDSSDLSNMQKLTKKQAINLIKKIEKAI